MNKAPTLIDTIYRTSFSREPINGWRSNKAMRDVLTTARRFVLDEPMSEFLAVLSWESFVKASKPMRARIIEHLRMGSRLPHPVTWIEYGLRASMRKRAELSGEAFKPGEVSEREGWLLIQHPQIDTAFELILFVSDDKPDEHGFYAWTFPVSYAWVADDETPMPYRLWNAENGAAAACGLVGYKSDRVGLINKSRLIETPDANEYVASLVREWAGVMRRVFTLLATINDLPIAITDVRQSKGFVARNDYRKYLHHKTITLTIPAKEYRKVAKGVLAIAHRRAHGVRGHWRKDWRHPLSAFCEHAFSADDKHMTCTICKGRKSWIPEHQRGDASRGLVLHDYEVKHESERKP